MFRLGPQYLNEIMVITNTIRIQDKRKNTKYFFFCICINKIIRRKSVRTERK